MSGRGKGGKVKGKAKSRSSRAGLQFPVSLIVWLVFCVHSKIILGGFQCDFTVLQCAFDELSNSVCATMWLTNRLCSSPQPGRSNPPYSAQGSLLRPYRWRCTGLPGRRARVSGRWGAWVGWVCLALDCFQILESNHLITFWFSLNDWPLSFHSSPLRQTVSSLRHHHLNIDSR